jgi:peroxiredoxin
MQQFLLVSSFLLWVVVGFNLLLTVAMVRKLNAMHPEIQSGLKPGTEAPEFTAQTTSGEAVTLADFAGRKVAFLFISPRCDPCREAMPNDIELFPKAKQAGLDIMLVSNTEMDETKAFVEEFKLSRPIILAPRDLLKDYNALSTPSFCLINEQGKVISSGYPSKEFDGWKKLVETLN